MQTENLNTKNIWEFEKGDTIYISAKSKDSKQNFTLLCSFERLVRNTVYGKVLAIDNSTSWNGIKVGDVIYNDIKKCALFGKAGDEINACYHWFNTLGYAYKELKLEKTEKVIKHPSFGMVGLSRRSSSHGVPLFGSNIQHQHTITLTIKKAELNRHLNNDWFHGNEQLIEIELSGSQYAELISSFNQGDGVPCTIRQFDRHSYPDPPYESPIDIFQREFQAKMENLGKECQSAIEDSITMLKEKQSIGKADRDFLINSFTKLVSQISNGVPFVSQQFNESMEKTISEAKNEIETFVNSRITSLGLQALKDNPDSLIGLGENKDINNLKLE